MNYLFRILSTHDTSGGVVLDAIVFLIQGIDETLNNGTLKLLRSYSDNHFNIFGANDAGCYVYDVLVREWILFIRDSTTDCEILLKYSSFMFKLIFKSMVLKINSTGEIKGLLYIIIII